MSSAICLKFVSFLQDAVHGQLATIAVTAKDEPSVEPPPDPPHTDAARSSPITQAPSLAAQPSTTAAMNHTGGRVPPGAPSTAGDALRQATALAGTIVEKLPRIRQTIAKRMMQSLHNSAQLTTVVEVDVTDIAALRNEHKHRFVAETGMRLSFLPFFAKATIEALSAHRVLAATVNGDCTEIFYHDVVNLGIAVDGPKGLMVPVIHDAARSTITDLAVTITNTGSRGALFDTPILNPPQSGILGTGAVVDRVVPWRDRHGGMGIAVRSMVYLSATYDHRVVDGADSARFLNTIKGRLEHHIRRPVHRSRSAVRSRPPALTTGGRGCRAVQPTVIRSHRRGPENFCSVPRTHNRADHARGRSIRRIGTDHRLRRT